MKKCALTFITFIAIIIIITACEDDKIAGNKNDGRISFEIVNETVVARSNDVDTVSIDTVSGGRRSNVLTINGDTIFFSFKEQDNTDLRMLKPVKRAQSRDAAFDNDEVKIPKIFATAILEDVNKTVYFQNAGVDIDKEDGIGTTGYYWPVDKLSFFAHAVSKDNVTVAPTYSTNGETHSGTFSYTLPVPSTEDVKKDATNQPDVVFAITPNQDEQESVPLQFHHALSAIVFKVGTMPEGVSLKNIVIEGVYSSGICSMVSTSSTDKPRDILFDWTITDETPDTYIEHLDNQNAVEGEQMGGKNAMFMLVPQDMTDETKLTLNFSVNGRDYKLERNFKDFISSWEADKKYIFTIGLPDEVKVEVTDVVNGLKKEDVKITNVGLSTAYIRAKIIGYWVIPDDENEEEWYIVSGWMETDGKFDWGTTTSETETTHWRKHTDGYYYYMRPVDFGETTEKPLFLSYELTATAPVVNAQLELIIAAQAVIADEDVVDFAWPGNPIVQ